MANDYAALVIDFTARLNNLESQMGRAVRVAESSGKKIESAFSLKNLAKAGAGFAAGQIGVQSIRDTISTVTKLSDEWTRVRVLVQNVTDSVQDATRAQIGLFEAAQATRQNYGELSRSFASFARNAGNLGITSDEAVAIQKTVAQAVALSGARADSAASALVQFGQGIAAGVLRGEELNSVLEQTPKLARAIADGMGVSIGELIRMGKEGELSADKIVVALQKIAPKLQQEFDKVVPTIADSFVRLSNSFGNVIARIEDAAGPARILTGLINDISSGLDKLANLGRTDPASVAQQVFNAARARVADAQDNLTRLEQRPETPARNAGLPIARQAVQNAIAEVEKARAALAALNLTTEGKPLDAAERAAAAKFAKQQEDRKKRLAASRVLFDQLDGISNDFAQKYKQLVELRNNNDITDEKFFAALEKLKAQSGIGKTAKDKTPKSEDEIGDFIKSLDADAERLLSLSDKIRNAIDPLREFEQELRDINEAASRGYLAPAEANSARNDVDRRRAERAEQLKREAEPLTEVREELDAYLASLRTEIDLIGLTEPQREARLKLLDAEKKGLEQTSQEWENYRISLEAALGANRLAQIDGRRNQPDSRTADILLAAKDFREKMEESSAMGYGNEAAINEEWLTRVAAILDGTQEVKDAASGMGEAFQSAFEKAVVGGENLRDVMGGLAEDIATLILRAQITKPLGDALNRGMAGAFGGDTLFDAFSSIFGFGGFRAAGGPVSANKPYIVGEKGAELFMPGQSGTIVPNNRLGGGMTVVQHFDLRNSAVSAQIVEAAARRGAAMARAERIDSSRRGYAEAI